MTGKEIADLVGKAVLTAAEGVSNVHWNSINGEVVINVGAQCFVAVFKEVFDEDGE